MPEKISKEKRSKIMGSIRARSKLENRFSNALWSRGIRFRKNDRSLYGTPDIFIDSCFWHHCPIHGKIPKTNEKFWKNKLKRNVERDEEVTKHYIEDGWNIVRIWEHELNSDFEAVVDKIDNFIQEKS